MGLGAEKRLCRAAVIRQKDSLECSNGTWPPWQKREAGRAVGTHLVTSSKGVKMERVLTIDFWDFIIKGLM